MPHHGNKKFREEKPRPQMPTPPPPNKTETAGKLNPKVKNYEMQKMQIPHQYSDELEESARMRQQSIQKEIVKGSDSKNPITMGSPLYGKISSACKAAAKRKFKVWPSAYASGWGVRCTKAGGPSNYGGSKKK